MNKAEFLKKLNRIFDFVLIAFSLLMFCDYAVKCMGSDIWYDEVFSVDFAGRSFKELVSLTAADVHPPFYYIYLKILSPIIRAVIPGHEIIPAMKLCSLLPLIIMLILGITFVRKHFNLNTAAAFMFLISAMPKLADYYVEIRMYSLCMLLVFLSFLFGSKILDGKKIYFIPFAVCGIITAYTQYYALIAIVGLYISLFICFILLKRYKDIIKLIICVLVSALCYIPWLPSFFSQIGAVESGYWIEPMSLRSIFGCIKFMYLPGLGAKGYIFAGLMIAASAFIIIAFIIKCIKQKKSVNELYTAFGGTLALIIIILTGFIFTFLGHPIFVYRYMLPAFGAFYLGLAFMLTTVSRDFEMKETAMFIVLFIPFILGGDLAYNNFNYEESNKLSKAPEASEALNTFKEDENAVIVCNFDQLTTLMDYYIGPERVYLYEDEVDTIVTKMYENDGQRIENDEIKALLESGNSVYFFGSFNSREDILSDWETLGIGNEEIYDSILEERYYFNVYRLY